MARIELYGKEYELAGIVMIVLLIGVASAAIGKVAPAYFTTEGISKVHFKVTGMVLVINLIFNFILMPKFGIIGAAIASTISYTFYGIIYIAMLKKSGIPIKELLVMQKGDFIKIKGELLKVIKRKEGNNG